MKPATQEALHPRDVLSAGGDILDSTSFAPPGRSSVEPASAAGNAALAPLVVPPAEAPAASVPLTAPAAPAPLGTAPTAAPAPAAQGELDDLRTEVERLRRLAEEAGAAADRERALLKVVQEQSPQGITVFDAQGKLVLQNRAAERIWAGSATHAAGTWRAFHRDGRPYQRQDWAVLRALSTRQPIMAEELRFQRFDGTHGMLLGSCAPLVGREGLLLGAVWVFTDITHLKQIEAENARLLEERTRFFNMVSHELGNILTPINVHVQLMKESPVQLDDRQRRSLDVLDRNVERLTLLLKDVMDVARMQGGRLTVERQPVELGRMVLEAMESFQESARQQGVRLEWQASAGIVVEADPKRVTQVLFNLLSNALKYTPEGGTITLEAVHRDDHAVVRVRDTGKGLPADALSRLFQPFSQVHERRDAPPGTGLGLFISKGIVEAHGGRIWAESEGPGRGATFAFTLPLTREARREREDNAAVRMSPT